MRHLPGEGGAICLRRDEHAATRQYPRRVRTRAREATAWARTHRFDIVVSLALFGMAATAILTTEDFVGPAWVNLVGYGLAATALVWRRTHPLLALLGVWVAIDLVGVLVGSSRSVASGLMVAVAVFTAVRAREPLAAVLVIAISGGVIRDLTDELTVPPDLLFNPMLVAIATGAGLVARQLQDGRRAVAERNEALAAREAALAEAVVAEERLRIARELHDIVAHSLSVMVLQAGAAQQVLPSDRAQADDLLTSIRETGTTAIEEMRSVLSVVESPPEPRSPLPTLDDLDGLIERAQQAGLDIEARIGDLPASLPASLQLSAYRVVQEAVTNTMKHAEATRIEVDVRISTGSLVVEVVDDGIGARDGSAAPHGLTGLAERVSAFGGQFAAGACEGGWRVRAAFPVAL